MKEIELNVLMQVFKHLYEDAKYSAEFEELCTIQIQKSPPYFDYIMGRQSHFGLFISVIEEDLNKDDYE